MKYHANSRDISCDILWDVMECCKIYIAAKQHDHLMGDIYHEEIVNKYGYKMHRGKGTWFFL